MPNSAKTTRVSPAGRAYQTTRVTDWTRTEVLIALYNAAISHIERAIEETRQSGSEGGLIHRLRASRIVMGLEAGLDHSFETIPEHIEKLCHYVRSCLADGQTDKLESAKRVLMSLREGFEALQLDTDEHNLTPLANDKSVDVTA